MGQEAKFLEMLHKGNGAGYVKVLKRHGYHTGVAKTWIELKLGIGQ